MLLGVAPSAKKNDFTARLRHLLSLFFFAPSTFTSESTGPDRTQASHVSQWEDLFRTVTRWNAKAPSYDLVYIVYFGGRLPYLPFCARPVFYIYIYIHTFIFHDFQAMIFSYAQALRLSALSDLSHVFILYHLDNI